MSYLFFGYGQETVKWKEITSEKGNFSISLPDLAITVDEKPKVVNKEEIPRGEFSLTTENVVYSVRYIINSNSPVSLQKHYLSLAESLSRKFEEQETKGVMLGRYEGKEFRLASRDGETVVIGRVYVIGEIAYEILALTRVENAKSPDIEKYLNSFKVLVDPAKVSEDLLSFGKNFSSYVVNIKTYDKKGNLVEKGKGFLADNGEIFTSKTVINKSSRAVVTTSKGESYQIRGVIADYVEGTIVKLVPEKPILGVKVLAINQGLPTKNSLVVVIDDPITEKVAVFGLSSSYPMSNLESVHSLSLDLRNRSGELEEGLEGSPVINSEGKLVGIVTNLSYKDLATNKMSLLGECMDFTSTETRLEKPLNISEWLDYVLKREREKHKDEPGVVRIAITGVRIAPPNPPNKDTNNTNTDDTNNPLSKAKEVIAGTPTSCDEYTIRDIAINAVEPEYPAEAKENHIEGDVIVKLLIDEQGKIIEAQAINGHKLLQKAALDAAKQWTFRHPVRDELSRKVPVKVSSQLTFSFKLSD